MPEPLVTVLMPTVGRMAYFPAAVEAVRAQTYRNLEILIGDNASTDGTAEYIEKMKAADPRIRSYYESERSMPVNWQHGLDLARGEYLTIVSDDDLVLPTFIARCVAELQADPSVEVAACLCDLIDGEDRPLPNRTAHQQEAFRRFGAGRQELHWRTHIPLSTIMCCVMRADWTRTLGFLKETGLAADIDFYARAGLGGYVTCFIHEALIRYRLHTGGASRFPVRQLHDSCVARLSLLEHHPEAGAYPLWRQSFRPLVEAYVTWLIRAGQRLEALAAYKKYREHLGGRSKVKVLTKVLLNAVGIYPGWFPALPEDPAFGSRRA